MARIVNVHHVDKEAFFSNNEEEIVDNGEKVMVFANSPTYAEVVARVR